MMPQSEYEPTQSSRLGGFLKRLLLAFVKLGLVFIVLIALAGVGWLIYQELNRSFNNVNKRMDFNAGRIDEIENDFEAISATGDLRQEQVKALQTVVAGQEAMITTLESSLDAVQTQQAEDLGTLEEQINTVVASTDTISGNLAVLNEGLVALQQDITTNVSDIDAVGGAVDALRSDLATLAGELTILQLELDDYSAAEFKSMGQALALFRVWELVSRARLRLIEQNLGLAATDINAALTMVDRLLVAAEANETSTDVLEQVQQRLTLAASSLPDNLATARDLETAWQLLDASLAEVFGEEPAAPQATSTPEATTTP